MKNETDHVAQRAPLEHDVISIGALLSLTSLAIPAYQRPYKWTGKNVQQLFDDIATHKDKPSYRLGTIVLHREGGSLNVVDGQQRIITLLLTIRALVKLRMAGLMRPDLKEQLRSLGAGMIQPSFESEISQANIRNNYLAISRFVERPDFSEELIGFLLNRAQVVVFELTDISEAFQFFDSQNARGRDLEPHDLLKAYHLREFDEDEQVKANTVARWENTESEELAELFGRYLYRMRNWSKGRSARYFGKDDTHLFKGVNLDTMAAYPHAEQLRIVHHFVDAYNRQFERKIDGRDMAFPFRLDQTIVNGRRFFEMTAHYQERIASIRGKLGEVRKLADAGSLGVLANRIVESIDSYGGRRRTGDGFVRTMFDCLLICYIDKFGFADISRAIEKIFIWAYTVRLQMESVQLATVDNYVLDNNLFRVLGDAILPADFLNRSLPVVERIRSSNTKEINQLFKDMRYAA
ncbi:DUF262 domain-containing protein [Massilia arenae]|uniref:DUF262 domain-containing protein n=1 Tax=Massilia arenae TaxID=2603288 RepID=A0A5C7FZC9_9BURK|nr:DUF262 domain-containing protein [Massilia arenae]TXF98015.1 DUF262 domain-containing protein [Massilia arenae]